MVDPKHTRLGMARQCSLVSISRSSFYYEGKRDSHIDPPTSSNAIMQRAQPLPRRER